METAKKRFQVWASRSALPLWASAGFDRIRGRFEEGLTLEGKLIADIPMRLMVQARQIFSYGVAARNGWYEPAGALMETAYASLVRDYYRADGRDGWIFSIWRDGTIADAKRDLYGHAFVLLAIASYVAVTGKREALALADETLEYLDRAMRAPYGGGYVEVAPPEGTSRRQNPHMHLLEALLALWRASTDRRYLARAEGMFELFRTKFFQPQHGALGEYYDEDLMPVGGQSGKIVEPGHHYEWIWLLRQFEEASGRNVQPYVDALYRHADRYGYAPNGLVVDEVLDDGRVHTPSHRVWPVTEAIKANVVEAARGRAGAAERANALVVALFADFLSPAISGGWIDRLDAAGRASTNFMPASTLYHLVCALEVMRASPAKA